MKFAILTLAVSAAAFAQNTQSVLHFANLNPQSFQEVSQVLRTVADLTNSVPDPEGKSITITGTAAQIAIAEWVALRLDAGSAGTPQLYTVPDASDDTIQVIDASAAQSPAALQQLVNVVRTTADANRVFPFNATKSIVMRAPSERVKLASWLVGTLLAPPKSVPAEFLLMNDPTRYPQKRIHLYVFQKATSPYAIQEMINTVRTVADINRVFPFNQTHAIVARGNDDQIAIADWLSSMLDKIPPGQGEASAHIQIQFPPTPDIEERVFYLPATTGQADIQQLVNRIRTDTKMNIVIPSLSAMAISMRGSATQVAQAEEIVRSH
jgi:hypothetical protein